LGLQPNWMVRWTETTTTALVNDFTAVASKLSKTPTAFVHHDSPVRLD
jgi:NAD(P)H-quinone oxidoreductase subunit 4